MFIQPFYHAYLSQVSYYIENGKEAAVIDPARNIEPYLQLANERGATIKFIFETHLHIDFISGHFELASKTDATIVFGPYAKLLHPIFNASHNEEFILGKKKIRVLHTPGHTVASSCYLTLNEKGVEEYIFTGDTLLVDEVGRPGLIRSDLTQETLSEKLYESVHLLLTSLPDNVIIYPGHRNGALCNRVINASEKTTINEQKKNNIPFNKPNKESFIKHVGGGFPFYPPFFLKIVQQNRQPCLPYNEVINRNYKPLNDNEFLENIKLGAFVLDCRPSEFFAVQHIPNSLNIAFEDYFLRWVGTLVPPDKKILLVCNPEDAKEIIGELATIGYENIVGFLEHGIASWNFIGQHRLASIKSTTFNEARKIYYPDKFLLIDIRD